MKPVELPPRLTAGVHERPLQLSSDDIRHAQRDQYFDRMRRVTRAGGVWGAVPSFNQYR